MVKRSYGQGNHRKLKIASCETCLGKPETEGFCISGLEGNKCTTCGEVVEWWKVQTKKPEQGNEETPDFDGVDEVVIEIDSKDLPNETI